MGSRPSRTKGGISIGRAGRTTPRSIFPSKNSRPDLESAIFLFRDSHGGTEGALKQRQSSAVWEKAREWRKSSRIERPRVGAARRADPRFRRGATSHQTQILPQSRRDAEEGVIETPRISAARTTATISSAPHSGSRSNASSPGKH